MFTRWLRKSATPRPSLTRRLTREYPCSFVSLYQAGEGIYEQFDKVLVIDEGRQVYFGPANEARRYMMSLGYADLPRQTTADYLTGCTDPNERKLADGRSVDNVPSTSEALAEAFKHSEIHARMIAEREAYKAQCEADVTAQNDFRDAVAHDKRRGVSKKSPYTASFLSQVGALVVRQFQLKAQDRTDFIVSWTTNIVIALITGSVYFLMPETASGAFTRGGLIFIVRAPGCLCVRFASAERCLSFWLLAGSPLQFVPSEWSR